MKTTTFPPHVPSLYMFLTASLLIHTLLLCVPFASPLLPKTAAPQNSLIAVELLMPELKAEKRDTAQQTRALIQPAPQTSAKKNHAAKAPVPQEPKREATVSLDHISQDDIPYRSYIGYLRSKIGFIWEQSDTARDTGLNGTVTVRFSIDRNGSLQALTITKHSAHQLLDSEALGIIKTAAPFSPFPQEFSIETLHVTASFEYEFNRH
jgi:protein TonB